MNLSKSDPENKKSWKKWSEAGAVSSPYTLLSAPEWSYFYQGYPTPVHDVISIKNNGTIWGNVLAVLRDTGLSKQQIQQIYRAGYCPNINNVYTWSLLAKLVQKTIYWVHCHDNFEGKIIRVYYPDGSHQEPV